MASKKVKLVRDIRPGTAEDDESTRVYLAVNVHREDEAEVEGDLPETDEYLLLTIPQAVQLAQSLSLLLDESDESPLQ